MIFPASLDKSLSF